MDGNTASLKTTTRSFSKRKPQQDDMQTSNSNRYIGEDLKEEKNENNKGD